LNYIFDELYYFLTIFDFFLKFYNENAYIIDNLVDQKIRKICKKPFLDIAYGFPVMVMGRGGSFKKLSKEWFIAYDSYVIP
jgi:hypothetical protein